MTDEQADELLKNNDWAKWSDARELLMEAAHRGAMAERKNLETELRRLHVENQMLWKEREEPHKTIDLYIHECNRLESERDEARRTVRETHEAGTHLTAQRDLLLGVLKGVLDRFDPYAIPGYEKNLEVVDQAVDAIRSVEGGK